MRPCSSIIDQVHVLEAIASRADMAFECAISGDCTRSIVDMPGWKYALPRTMELIFGEFEEIVGGNRDLPAEAFACGVPATRMIGGAWYTMAVSGKTPSSRTANRTV